MISTHILDTTSGMPASNVEVKLLKLNGQEWSELEVQKTNADGRSVFSKAENPGVYRLQFMVEDYFSGKESFYTQIPVVFKITSTNRKYHVPLLLNPFGYSTYRGS